MAHRSDLQTKTNTKPKTPWKYRLTYIFIVWIVINCVPKDAAFVTFIGAVIIYPFAMSFLNLSQADFFKRERTYLWEHWKALPIWGKFIGISTILVLPTGGVGVSLVSSIISLALTIGIFWFIYQTVAGYARKGASHIKDMAEKHLDED